MDDVTHPFGTHNRRPHGQASRALVNTPARVLLSCVALLAVLALLPIGCAATDGATALDACGMRPPSAVPGHTGRFWYVQAARCADGDGSAERPFIDLKEALGAARAGDTVVLGEAQFPGGVQVPAGVNVVAATNGTAIITGGAGVELLGAEAVTVRGIIIEKARGVGLTATGGRVRLEDVSIRGVLASKELAGHGVAVQGVDQLTLIRSEIVHCEGLGLIARGAGKVSIIEPIYVPSPRSAAGKFGIIEPIYLPRSRIANNALGGVAIIEPIYSPAGSPNLTLESTDVADNGGFGVGLWGASLRVVNSAIHGTRIGPQGPWADGVMLAAGLASGDAVAVQIDARSVIAGNARTGVAMLGKASLQVAGDVSNNGLCGVWAGQSSVVTVTGDASFGGNVLVGIAVAEGADLLLDGATVRGTVAQTLAKSGKDRDAGDGIGVFDGARATIRNARLQNNARAGVVVDHAKQLSDGTPDVLISGSVVSDGKYAVVVNGSPAPSFKTGNTYESADAAAGNNSPSGSGGATQEPSPEDQVNASMPVKTTICEAAADCAPTF